MTTYHDSPSRLPSEYEWSDHFSDEAMEDKLRFLTEEMVNETIRDGYDCQTNEAGPGKIRRKKEFNGVNAVLVLPLDNEYVITGWTEVKSFAKALQSDRWTHTQLKRIRGFQNYEHKTFRADG